MSPNFKNARQSRDYLWSKREIDDMRYTIEPIGFTPGDMKNDYDSLVHEIKTHGIEIEV